MNPSTQKPLRLGSVPYLNAKALVWGLENDPKFTLEFHPPSILAQKFHAGEIDLALLSTVELFRHPEYRLVPGPCVSGFKTMWSILLFLRTPLEQARRIALDPDSETTNALLKILQRERWKNSAELVPLKRGEDPMRREDLDGFLKIGDPALAFHAPGLLRRELMADWDVLTGLPFVFAAWLARPGVDVAQASLRLSQARDEGLRHADEIAAAHFESLGISKARALEYVSTIVRYHIGPEEAHGLRQFEMYYRALPSTAH